MRSFDVPETPFLPGAITPGTPVLRDLRRTFPGVPYPYRTWARIDNHRGSSTITMTVNGQVRRAGPGAVVTVTAKEVGPIGYYTLDSDAVTGASDVTVFESGGLYRAD